MQLSGGILAAVLMLGLGGGALVLPLQAQDVARQQRSILIIDQAYLFTGSLFGERVTTDLKRDLKALELEFQKLEADLTAEEKQLTEKRPSLTPDAFRQLADAFDKKVQAIRRAQDLKARGLDRRMEQSRAKYYGLINPILQKMMGDLGASLIIDRRAVLVGAEGVDITKEALRLIDATLGDGVVQPELGPDLGPEPAQE